jgi:acetamidase/formamidase
MTSNRKAVALACLAFGVAVSGSASAQGTPPPAEAKKDAPQAAPAKPSPVPDLQKPDSYLPFLYGPLDPVGMTAPSSRKGKTHIVAATPATTQWGYFDSSQAPVLRINPGDTVVMETMTGAHNQIVPGVTIEQINKIRLDTPGRGPHTVTGPIYVEGAEPGDILRIRINKIVPRSYASNQNLPGFAGLFPKEFPQGQIKYFYLDVKKMQMEFAPGIVVPLRPFPGVLAVARAEPGKFNTVQPGRYAGNLDLRELTAGTALYVQVFQKGGLLWTGDSHAGQGNGEINLTAIETAFQEFNVTIDLIKQRPLEWPRIETPTHWITVGYDRDLNTALDIMKAETVKFIAEHRKVSRDEAEKIMYEIWNCPIAEMVNITKGTYCMIPKNLKAAKPAPLPKQENAKFLVTYGKDADVDKAMQIASMEMINTLEKKKGLPRLDAYSLASIAMDCRIAPHRGGDKEVHCMTPKSLWTASR